MKHYTLEDFPEMDSLYRLVNIAARRANQVNKPETRAFVSVAAKKPTMVALEEITNGKIGYLAGESEDDEYSIG